MRRALSGQSARRSGMYVVSVGTTARGVSVPAPVGGWNTISPLSNMPPNFAITLENLFPQPGYLEIRKGHKTHYSLAPEDAAVETLMAYHALTDADDRLLAVADGKIYDVTVTSTVSAAHSGLTNSRLQHVNISTAGGNFVWMCNGADKPLYYDGSVFTTTSITGVTATDIVHVAVFKERLWLTLKDSMKAAYLPPDAIQGTATPFDLSGLFNKGGYLQAIGSWSLDAGSGPDDYLAFVTSRGEVAIYTGIDPSSATDFTLKGVYEMGAPLGRRCLTKVGADLAVISIDGVLPLSKALITDRAAAISAAITANIQPTMNQSARDYGDNFGWELVSYPRGTRAILNVPVQENTQQVQYVMNTVTGAWCKFSGENANCWAVFQDRLFYGDNAGLIKEADCQGFDDDAAITFDVETAFNYCGARGKLKQFDMARTLLTTDGQVTPGMTVNTDFAREQVTAVNGAPVSATELWDVASWDAGTWPTIQNVVTDWTVVAGIGYCASIRMSLSITASTTEAQSQSLTLQINGWDLLLKDGAFI